MSKRKVFVTEPSLPPLEEFQSLLSTIWDTRNLTNSGPFSKKLERELTTYLDVPNISLLSSGSAALFCAIKSLGIKGEVVTTPFTFPATTQQINLAGLKPVFVDIDRNNFNIDPSKIEAAITENTSAILGVHCYGVPCDVNTIQEIADKHGLKVLYDAAHAFGVNCHCGELFKKGDVSILSFHATKVFNTFEGGAAVTNSKKIKKYIDQFKNFGIGSDGISEGPGTNAKMPEVSAALGVLQLKYIDNQIYARKCVYERYKQNIKNFPKIAFPALDKVKRPNFSYLPIRIKQQSRVSLDDLIAKMNARNIFPRKYFNPLVSNLEQFSHEPSSEKNNLPVANQLVGEVLCLPIYEHLDVSTIDEICEIILRI